MGKFARALAAFGFSASLVAGCASAPPPETLEQASARLSAACPEVSRRTERVNSLGSADPLEMADLALFNCECVASRIVKPTLNTATGQYNGPQIPREDGVRVADTLIQAITLYSGLEALVGSVSDVTLNHVNGCFGK